MRSILSSHLAVVILLVLVALVGFTVVRQSGRSGKANEQIEAFSKQIQRLESENEQIRAGIDSFAEPSTIEREARERLNLKREGEEVVVILPADGEAVQDITDDIILQEYERRNLSSAPPENESGLLQNLRAWLEFLF